MSIICEEQCPKCHGDLVEDGSCECDDKHVIYPDGWAVNATKWNFQADSLKLDPKGGVNVQIRVSLLRDSDHQARIWYDSNPLGLRPDNADLMAEILQEASMIARNWNERSYGSIAREIEAFQLKRRAARPILVHGEH